MPVFNDTEEKAVEEAIAALVDMIPLEAIQPPHSPALTFPGLEIRLHQRRVLKNGIEVSLTRLEYGVKKFHQFLNTGKGLDIPMNSSCRCLSSEKS